MRVLQVITDRDRRGAQVFALDLAAGLGSLGVDVTTVALENGQHAALDVTACGGRSLGLRTLWSLRKLMRSADVVIAHGGRTLPAVALAGLGVVTPAVYRQISDPTFWASSPLRRIRVAGFLRRVDRVVALADDVGEVFRDHYWLAQSTVTVIPNAVRGELYWMPSPSERASSRQLLGLPADRRVVAFVGALVPEKGCALAVQAAADEGCALLVAGDGPERSRLEQLASSLSADVRFLGSVGEMRSIYWASDVVVLPSLGGDSMPGVLIEAALCGVPSVASDVGSISSTIADGRTGTLVRSGDLGELSAALRCVLSDDARRHSLGVEACRTAQQEFTIDATAPRWLAVLRDVAGERR